MNKCESIKEGGDIGLFITLVPKALLQNILNVDLKTLGTFTKILSVSSN